MSQRKSNGTTPQIFPEIVSRRTLLRGAVGASLLNGALLWSAWSMAAAVADYKLPAATDAISPFRGRPMLEK